MKKEMYDALDKFYAEKHVNDVDRNTFLVCNLEDKTRRVIISLVFIKDLTSLKVSDDNIEIIEGKGAVITLPCYWVSIPKPLAMSYTAAIIDDLYTNEIDSWTDGSSSGSSGTTGGSGSASGTPGCNNCPCPVI